MLKRAMSGAVLLGGIAVATTGVGPVSHPSSSLTVHEWGTFTTVAGEDGRAIDWYPLGGPSDLPCFVERFRNGGSIVPPAAAPSATLPTNPPPFLGKEIGVVIARGINPAVTGSNSGQAALASTLGVDRYDYEATRANVRAKVRMETPVLYFYSPDEVTANVRVTFPQGLMTEWYPSATVTQGEVGTATLSDPSRTGSIEWKNVVVSPLAKPSFLAGNGPSHYFAARATDAVPLSVNGESEKFLFYRGVANFDVPISATLDAQGGVSIRNIGAHPLPVAILFENRAGKIGFRVQRTPVAAEGAVTLEEPTLNADFDTLRVELERTLVSAGLFPREAAAMIDTWRDSWFEEGTRVFYLFAPQTVDAVLPLAITPTPSQTVRVFVGRMEIVTPALEDAVSNAMIAHDTAALASTARFFGPIADRILGKSSTVNKQAQYAQMANTLLASYVRRLTSCEQ